MKSPTLPGHQPPATPRPGAGASTGDTTASRHFPATAASVAQARRFLLLQLPEGSGEDADALVLMLSELATNAVRHAASEYVVSVRVAGGGRDVLVEVSDAAGGYPVPQEQSGDAPHGRGLHIVQALADAWGIEMQRDRPGKTVWFSSRLPDRDGPAPGPLSGDPGAGEGAGEAAATAADRGGAAPLPHAAGTEQVKPDWPLPAVRAVLDGLSEAIVATDEQGVIHYANATAEHLMGWPRGSLVGRSALELVPDSQLAPFAEGFQSFVRTQADALVGRALPVAMKRPDGSHVETELVLSMFDHPLAGRVVAGIFRSHEDRRLQRWSELTSELLEILADAPIDDPPAERLLSTLGRRLDWDVTTLWALSPGQELVCRHVWTRTPVIAPAFAEEKATDPTSGSSGLPRWVMEHSEPIWVPDLTRDRRFMTGALARDGLQSAYAFPIRYRGVCVGVVKMLSRQQRERDASVVELMDAVGGHLGELLHASAQAAEREQLVDELLEARRRNEFLLLATQVLSEVVDYREMVERLAQVSVPVMADLCLIDIEDEEGKVQRMAAWHADPAKRPLTEALRNEYPPDPDGAHPIIKVMHSGQSMWSSFMDDGFLKATSRDGRHYSILKELGFTSYMTVPLRLHAESVLGTVTLVSAGSGRRFSEKDLGMAEQLAAQVSSVVSRARAYDRERRISHELQRNMLPDAIPGIEGWDISARYLPAAVGIEVGGDWYDVVPITERLVALVVGDVEGHDLEAAKIMSRLRHTLGLLVLEEQAPGKALERLNRIALSGVGPRLATALVGVLDTVTGSISFASAGHLSPVRIASGQVYELPVPPGPPLGVQRCHYKDHEFRLDQGCVMMFTDGLVERRGAHLDERLRLLESSLRASPSTKPGPVADYIIDVMTAGDRSADDIVVLTACRQDGGDPPG
ncbi:MAG: SpoIIE family protein phosphatase [Acidimicrobiales bacterium]